MVRLYDELVSVLHLNSYNDITFYLNSIPIVTVHLNHDDNTVTIITNNMSEMNYHQYHYSQNPEEIEVEVQNILIDNGIEDLLQHNANANVTFSSLFLSGRIDSHQVQIEQLEIIDSNDNTAYNTYTFNNNEVSIFTIAEIIAAFVHQFFS
ncbi:MAG: hypothetical protein RXR43_16000 [Sulfolobus sp.]